MKKLILYILLLSLLGCNDDVINTTNNSLETVEIEETAIETVEETPVEDGEIKPMTLEFGKTTVLYTAADGLDITADLYLIDETSPIFILFHKANWSRGEYKDTALKLNNMGYNVMAVDQRSGLSCNGIVNETAKRATEKGYISNYSDASMDVKASIQYAIDHFDTDIYVLGSSYSASLVLVVSQKFSEHIKGIFAFSPGEYFSYAGKSIAENTEKLTIPTFITSGSYETDDWQRIFESVGSDYKFAFYPEGFGRHGSESLWESTKENTEFWMAIEYFLEQIEEDAD
ncbi:MAG: alpha/beta hydrolase [Clostridiales bacterium]|nr:alpha/beta hydrolase [Clostridiales bacterium]